MDNAQLQRFMPKVKVQPNGCWIWQAAITKAGYGNFVLQTHRPDRVYRGAHRVAYEHWVGEIPDGMQLDHICRVRACVNPAHLEPVTNMENSRRGLGGWALTHCKQGHEYTHENTIWRARSKDNPTLRRACRACVDYRNTYAYHKSLIDRRQAS